MRTNFLIDFIFIKETHFDKWLYVLRNLEDLTKQPAKLQEKIFAKLFEQVEIANYSEQEYNEYEFKNLSGFEQRH